METTTAAALASMELPWEVTSAMSDTCGNASKAAILMASPTEQGARLPPESRGAQRLTALMNQLNQPIFQRPLPKLDPQVKAERAAAAASAGPITADTVFEPCVHSRSVFLRSARSAHFATPLPAQAAASLQAAARLLAARGRLRRVRQ